MTSHLYRPCCTKAPSVTQSELPPMAKIRQLPLQLTLRFKINWSKSNLQVSNAPSKNYNTNIWNQTHSQNQQ
ncbi:hypothetical protein PSTT_06486 [Puccinia striiformis]|uniref:Uncharacterized protein n=1 Tax=Puccinia striiformis TaxID=27350 RepID=A0A2S4VK21_9BASI|nr:hypothetical protein PSTT_06486 [Puccinia striiformis]